MQNKDIIQRIWPFFLFFFIFIFLGLALIQYFGRNQLHLAINQYHHPVADQFFKFYTEFGTTGMFILLLFYIVWKKNWITLGYIAITEIIAGLFNVFVKKAFFKHVHRPSYYFYQNNIELYLPADAQLQIPYTFPSGHTLLAIIITMTLCTMTNNRLLQGIFSLHFIGIAYSRMYLSKHFMIDTLGGAVLGMFTFILVFYLLNNSNKKFLHHPIIKQNK
ncbi:MAG TPA: phosphatase PAP2 family protein [Faecalibacter sp.]